jgi:histidinol-phosphate aminotransferase
MSLTRNVREELVERGYSRRQVAKIALGASAVIPFFHEFAFAGQDDSPARRGGVVDADVVRITSNENPMGPAKEALEAIAMVAPKAWRYTPEGANTDMLALMASTEGLKPEYVLPYPGSGTPLANLVPAFSSPTKAWVMGQPGYGSGASRDIGNKVIHVPLRKDYSHDVEAMIKMGGPTAGVFYVCNPNNPTGTLTPRKDLEYILANKPKGSILVVDEAYIHFTGRDNMSTDLVKADKDVVVLRTFSKIYGMAGLRAGVAYGRPDLLAQLAKFGRTGNISVATMAGVAASLKNEKAILAARTVEWQRNRDVAFDAIANIPGASAVPTAANFFMLAVKGMTGPDIGKAMASKKILLAGNRWPEWPQHIRVTVGTYEEMQKFNIALAQVAKEGPTRPATA